MSKETIIKISISEYLEISEKSVPKSVDFNEADMEFIGDNASTDSKKQENNFSLFLI